MTLSSLDYEEIRQLFGRYSLAVDFGDADAFADCFTIDGTFEILGVPSEADRDGAHRGEVALRRLGKDIFDSTRGHCRHWVSPLTIKGNHDGSGAEVVAYTQVLRVGETPLTGVLLTSMSWDTLKKVDGRWYFALRKARVDPQPEHPATSPDVLVTRRDDLIHRIEALTGHE